jgi:hypothetical protein
MTETQPAQPDERRTRLAATLRAVADLIDAHPELPAPTGQISYYVNSKHPDVPAAITAIVSGLPGSWKSAIRNSSSGEYTWLDFDLTPGCGVDVKVSAQAKDACTESGTRTVTTWVPLPEIAALADGKVEQE